MLSRVGISRLLIGKIDTTPTMMVTVDLVRLFSQRCGIGIPHSYAKHYCGNTSSLFPVNYSKIRDKTDRTIRLGEDKTKNHYETKLCITDDRFNENRNDKNQNHSAFPSLLSPLGFSLGILGFFEKQELSKEDKLLMEIKRAILAIQNGELSKAERHLANSWSMAEAESVEEVKTQIMDIQANLAFQKGELDKAIRLFQLVSQRLVYHQGVPVTANAIVEISIKLAQIFSIQGKDAESMAGFQFCADTQREKILKGETDEDTLMLAAWSLQSLAQGYMSSGGGGDSDVVDEITVEKAGQLAQEAYQYASQAVGSDSQQAVAINSDLASILALKGDLNGALEKLEECEKIAAEKHKFLQAAIRVNTGSLYLQKGEYSEAERICREAKVMAGVFKDVESVMRADECIAKSDAMKHANKLKI